MQKQTLSISFDIFTPGAVALDKQTIQGAITDLLAEHLAGLVDTFDLQPQYTLLTKPPQISTPKANLVKTKPTAQNAFPILNADGTMREVVIGSPEWFELLEAKKFRYRYQELKFTVRFETQTTASGEYHYWRAYCRIKGKLVTRQLGKRDSLSKGALDEVGAYFLTINSFHSWFI